MISARSGAGLRSGDAGRESSLVVVVVGVFGETGASQDPGKGVERASGSLWLLREGEGGLESGSGGGVLESMVASV